MLIKHKQLSIGLAIPFASLLISCSAGSTSNTVNGYVYLIPGSNQVQQCQVVNNVVNAASCKGMDGTFESPTAVAFDVSKTYAYVANGGNSTLSICTLKNDKSFNSCEPIQIGVSLSKPSSLVVAGNNLYIANSNSTVTMCTIGDGGVLSACSNKSVIASFRSITANGNSSLYGLTNSGAIYSYSLPDMTNGTQINYTESGVSNQINYNPTNSLLYIAAENGLTFGGGVYGCNLTTNPTSCITAFKTAQMLLPIPVIAPIYAVATTNNQAYFIDYALQNALSIEPPATLINSCSIAANGELANCNASVLSTDDLSTKGALAITYLGL